MKVITTQNTTQSLLQSASPNEKLRADFQATLEAAKQNIAQPGGNTPPAKSSESKGAHRAESQMTALEYLEDYLRKSPEQRMRDAILKKMGLTEEELAAMPPEKRAAIEQTITEKIKELLQKQHGNTQAHAQPPVSIQSLLT